MASLQSVILKNPIHMERLAPDGQEPSKIHGIFCNGSGRYRN
jgi:hypothetical protein